MFSWLVDHAGLASLVLGILALVLGSLWWMSRNRRYVFALAGVGVLLVLVWLLTLLVVTDRQQVIRTVETMARAIHQRKLDQFFRYVSPGFDHAGMNTRQFREYMEAQLRQHQVSTFQVTNILAADVSRETGKARAEFWIDIAGNWEGEAPPLRCETSFVLERDEWRLKGFKLFVFRSPTEFRLPGAR